MNKEDIPDMLRDMINISEDAGSIILKHYNNSRQGLQIKEDNSPLTIADTESDEHIRKELSRLYDSIPIVSEENYPEYSVRKEYTEYFLVDPLDGTKEFIEGNGEFTVNIAYIKDNIPVMGVIYVPVTGALFFAAENRGSYLKDSEGMHKLPLNIIRKENLIAVGSRKHSTSLDSEFLHLNNIQEVVPAGSSLKFCKVAMGLADLYPRFQGSMEWDIAAGHIIAQEAGCRVVDLVTMKEPLYNKESLLNNYFLVLQKNIDFSSVRIPVKI